MSCVSSLYKLVDSKRTTCITPWRSIPFRVRGKDFLYGVMIPALIILFSQPPNSALCSSTARPKDAERGGPRALEIFHIGKHDDSFMEFAQKWSEGQLVIYRVGRSDPAKDWYVYQPGSLDYEVGSSTREQDWINYRPGYPNGRPKEPVPVPFQVDFSLMTTPRGKFVLHLDAIFRYRRPAVPRYAVEINGHKGSYQLAPHPAPKLWWPTGSGAMQFVGYESLDMPLPAAYFRRGSNTLTVRCLDGFGIYYDDLSLTNKPADKVPVVSKGWIRPTIFYKQRGGKLVEVMDLGLRTSRPLGTSKLRLKVGSDERDVEVNQSQFGDVETRIDVSAPESAVPADLYIGGQMAPAFNGNIRPRRRWRVYAMPAEQADFGYDEVPSRTLIWENRYIDKAIQIEREYPSYSFTLDASANLESYLATRDEAHRQQLLNYLKDGRFGINGLYEPFFTGLATPEELFQMLDFSLRSGRKYGFPVDSASQTDEPLAVWSVPQVLAEAGIKYYADGSNPIRAPFNPIGLWNSRSPFYWETPNGTKVLVWSAVAYVVIEDMAWAGWNEESIGRHRYSPSLFGLEHTLPLFLSNYERSDYPFDAALLYGLHNDEVPIRHRGSADVIDLWNREYAYPKIIPGKLSDYFKYVRRHFGSQIHTYRGDEGAYWEEESGSDARIEAMSRTAQTQITTAETFESLAEWMNQFLKFDHKPFRDAWKNILLVDDFVWGDTASFRRPYSYLTRYSEDVHRGYGESAFRQTRDLVTMAVDNIGELIKSDQPGVVVLNSQSWPHNGFFDYELEPNQALSDPATGQTIPCGSLRSLDGYQEVRCWAQGVPALGYKFYVTINGEVPKGRKLVLPSVGVKIEGTYYTLQLDQKTGAVAHLIDKATGQDLVNLNSGYGLNEYLYVSGGDSAVYYHGLEHSGNADNRLLLSDPTLPVPRLFIHRPTLVGLPVVKRYPWGTTITLHQRAQNTPTIVSTITLNDMQKSVEFDNEVDKIATLKKEAVYFAFPIAVRSPEVDFQEATAWVNPERDMLPGANLQWFATQGGIRVTGAGESVVWTCVDAPLFTLEDIYKGLWPTTLTLHDGTLFSYIMNNYWYTDMPAQQGGHFRFRYALTSGPRLSLAQAIETTDEQRTSLTVTTRYHKGWEPMLPEAGEGFLSSSPEGVRVLTIRPTAEGNSYLIRVHNSTNKAVEAHLDFPTVQLADAYKASVLGERKGQVHWSAHLVRLPMSRYDVKTLVIRLRR
jgi:alpha-mannosidase